MKMIFTSLRRLYMQIWLIGVTPLLSDYDKRKLGVFNLLNAAGLISGIIVPLAGFFNEQALPALAWVVAWSPAVISFSVLYCNYQGRYELARIIYFSLYPIVTLLVYSARVDVGIELFFILYGVLSVFFLQKIANVVFSFSLSIICYLAVFLVWNEYDFRLIDENYAFYIFNHVLAAFCIFLGLFLIKKENKRYQETMVYKNMQLEVSNSEIRDQRMEIQEKAEQLEVQTQELKELDVLKNKLFSVIAHDLKTPMYALRNLFRNIEQYDMPGDEIKLMLPDIITDLNYTTGLMENLLQWAKSQMQSNAVNPQVLNLQDMMREVAALLRLQAEAKKIYVEIKADTPVYVYADKDMVNLVLRNLLSNAIKFTPENGKVAIGASDADDYTEVYVKDTGTGMSADVLQKISRNDFFTSKGTANESGTGLGLMLCKEFLIKNGGKMFIESEPGKGSVFSFVLPSSQFDQSAN